VAGRGPLDVGEGLAYPGDTRRVAAHHCSMSATDGDPADRTAGRLSRVFLSVAGPEAAWGEWFYRRLRDAGYQVDYYRRSFPVGENFVSSIDRALAGADRMVAVLAPGYCDPSSWVTPEWHAALQLSRQQPGFIVPVLVERCRLPPLLAGLNYVDVVGLDEAATIARVLDALSTGVSVGPAEAAGARFPGAPSAGRDRGDGQAQRAAELTVVHVADLVAGLGGPDEDEAGAPFGDLLREDLDRLMSDEDLHPDLVVVNGIGVSGRAADYTRARRRLTALTDGLELAASRVVLVPGRGDVSAAACRTFFAACEEDEIEPAPPFWRKWRHFVAFFEDFYRDVVAQGKVSPTFAVGQEWTLFPVPDRCFVVSALNSTMAMSHRPEDDYYALGAGQAEWFAERLPEYARRSWLRIAAVYRLPATGNGEDRSTRGSAGAVDDPVDGALGSRLGSHLDLILTGHGSGLEARTTRPETVPAPKPEPETIHKSSTASAASAVSAIARLPASGVPTVSCHPDSRQTGGPSAGTEPARYQVIRMDRTGLRRWDRRFDGHERIWRPDDRHGPAGRTARPIRWRSAASTFPDDPAAGGTGTRSRVQSGLDGLAGADRDEADGFGGRGDELFADRVHQIVQLRHPGATATLIETAGGAPAYFRVTVADGPVFEQRPVGIHEGEIDEALLDAFIQQVHSAYAATDQQLTSDLVYGGAPADANLVRRARRRGVRLRSFVEYQGLLDLRDYVRRQTATLAADSLYPPGLYLPQRYRLGGETEVRDDLLGQVIAWLDSDVARFLLLLGDFGRGKTFLLRELARTLPTARPQLVPLLVDLRSMEKAHSVDELVASHLVATGVETFDVRAFRYMLRSGRIVLLFDGFDELALRVTYETAADHLDRLLDVVAGQAKVVVTSRTQHFVSHGQVRSALGARVELLPVSKLAEVEDFTDEQISDFLVRLYGGDTRRARDRFDLIRDIRDLLGLSRNPRMLGFIAALDAGVLDQARGRSGVITSADLYRALIDSWLRYEERRATPRGAGPTLTAKERLVAVTALALAQWRSAGRLIGVGELTSAASGVLTSLAERGLDENQAAHMVGSGSLLVRSEDGAFSFIHQSVMEYLVAAEAARDGVVNDGVVNEGGNPAGVGLLGTRPMSPLMVDFYVGTAGGRRAAGWARTTLRDPDASPAARRNALAVARVVDSGAGRAARLAGASLDGIDIAGLDLASADLTGADLTAATIADTDLSGALLRDVNLTGARLERVVLASADLAGADLAGARVVDCDLRAVVLRSSNWARASLVGSTMDDAASASSELAAAAIPGRDQSHPQVDQAGPVTVAKYSPDGSLLAYAVGSAIVLVDTRSGARVATLTGHRARAWSLSFSPDGTRLATVSDDRMCRIWDLGVGGTETVIPLASARFRSVAFLADGQHVAVVMSSNEVAVVDVNRGETTATVTGPADFVCSLTVSPGGRTLAGGGGDGLVHLWRLPDLEPIAELDGHRGVVNAVAFSPDGRMLASGAEDATLRLWPVEDDGVEVLASESWQLQVPVLALAFAPDSQVLATGEKDGELRTWDVATGRTIARLSGHLDWIWAVAFSPDGREIVTGSGDGTVRRWDAASTTQTHVVTSRTNWTWAVAFSPAGRHVATGGDREIALWDVGTGRRVFALSTGTKPSRAVAFSRDGTVLAADSGDATVTIWNVATGRRIAVLGGHDGHNTSVAFSNDGRLVTVSGNVLRFWEVGPDTTHPLRTEQVHDSRVGVMSIALSPDDRELILGASDGAVIRYDLGDRRETVLQRTLPLGPQARTIWAVRISRDGRQLAWSFASTVTLWDLVRGEVRRVLSGLLGSARAVAFSPDGARLAAGGVDTTIRIWDTGTGEATTTLPGHVGTIRSVDFSADGRLLVSASDDGTVRLWDTIAGREIAALASFQGGGTATLLPDGAYKLMGETGGGLWWSAKLCEFDPGELDGYLPDIRRVDADAPIAGQQVRVDDGGGFRGQGDVAQQGELGVGDARPVDRRDGGDVDAEDEVL